MLTFVVALILYGISVYVAFWACAIFFLMTRSCLRAGAALRLHRHHTRELGRRR